MGVDEVWAWVRWQRAFSEGHAARPSLLWRATWRAPASLLWTQGRWAADMSSPGPLLQSQESAAICWCASCVAVVAVTPCSAPPAVAGTMSLTGQEKFETAPTDKRFPTTNQAKHCYM